MPPRLRHDADLRPYADMLFYACYAAFYAFDTFID